MDRRAYLNAIWVRYNSAPRTAKKPILDEFCAVCGYSRKYAIALLNKPLLRARRKGKPGRKPKYANPCFLEVLGRIWSAPKPI
jgi:hypothetical protein